jgi:hypothetical protein
MKYPNFLKNYGSSPPQRGSLHPEHAHRRDVRFIPELHAGSSPRAWGSRARVDGTRSRARLISARVGISGDGVPAALPRSVHPRACGDLGSDHSRTARQNGSSPRSRGPHQLRADRLQLVRYIPASRGPRGGHKRLFQRGRFIPALAGTSPRTRTRAAAPPVHTRARGDLTTISARSGRSDGSSPRSRGPPQARRDPAEHRRFIPALAGTSRSGSPASPTSAVHSRARGDLSDNTKPIRPFIGSSPALAGTSGARCSLTPTSTVHPRARGDLRHMPPNLKAVHGTSPRSRGPPLQRLACLLCARFIPALAGTSAPG